MQMLTDSLFTPRSKLPYLIKLSFNFRILKFIAIATIARHHEY